MPRFVNLSNLSQFTAVNVTSDPGYDPSDHTIPNCADIVLVWALQDGKQAHNVLHGAYTGGFAGTVAQCDAILNGLTSNAQWTALANFLAPTTSLSVVTLRDRNAENMPIIGGTPTFHVGTSTGTELPDEVAATITLRTAFTGPAHRGRIYVPGWATTALGAGNVIAAGAVTALANWGSIIAGVLLAQGYVFSIGHTHRLQYTSITGRVHPERQAGTVPITTVQVRDNHWDTQRRRGLK